MRTHWRSHLPVAGLPKRITQSLKKWVDNNKFREHLMIPSANLSISLRNPLSALRPPSFRLICVAISPQVCSTLATLRDDRQQPVPAQQIRSLADEGERDTRPLSDVQQRMLSIGKIEHPQTRVH